jgi:hypothetical protein
MPLGLDVDKRHQKKANESHAKRYISHMRGGATMQAIMKYFGISRDLADEINRSDFDVNQFSCF